MLVPQVGLLEPIAGEPEQLDAPGLLAEKQLPRSLADRSKEEIRNIADAVDLGEGAIVKLIQTGKQPVSLDDCTEALVA